MPRNDAEDLRRRQLVAATLDTIAEVGFGAATMALIGQRAGVSAGLIAHYFGDKDGLLEAALRSLAARLSRATTERLRAAQTPRARIQAVIEATLAPEEFEPRSCGVWLAFWAEVNHSERLRRIQTIYQQRMLSNLRHALHQMVPAAEARRLAMALAAMIDGLRLRATLSSPNETDSAMAQAIATAFIDDAIARAATTESDETETDDAGRIERAIAAALAAQPGWAALAGRARGHVLRDTAARLMDAGSTPPEAELMAAADCLASLADGAGLLAGGPWPGPPGLVALGGADEMSLAALCRTAGTALAFGGAVIIAPDPATATTATRLGDALGRAGLPPGLFSVLPAEPSLWPVLRRRPEVAVTVCGAAARYRTTTV